MSRFLIVLLFAGCFPNHDAAQNPTQPLEHPMPAREDSVDRVHGVVRVGDDMFPTPLASAAIELVKGGEVIRTTNTDMDGKFEFTGKVPEGMYEVRVGGDYVGSAKLDWGGSSTTSLEIRARQR